MCAKMLLRVGLSWLKEEACRGLASSKVGKAGESRPDYSEPFQRADEHPVSFFLSFALPIGVSAPRYPVME
jgi:hypothetical protein